MEPPNKIRRHGLTSQTHIHSYPSSTNPTDLTGSANPNSLPSYNATKIKETTSLGPDGGDNGHVTQQPTASSAAATSHVDQMDISNCRPINKLQLPLSAMNDDNKGKSVQANLVIVSDNDNIDDIDDHEFLFGSPSESSIYSKIDTQDENNDQGMSGSSQQAMVIVSDDDDDDDSLFGDPSSSDIEMDNTPPKQKKKALAGVGAPEAMSCVLLPHQRIGLEWLLKHEHSADQGAILADDMGLGKTIQALALIFANPPKNQNRKTTLIVAPLALLQQWPREIDDKTKPGYKLKVHVFHGKGRQITAKQLLSFDVVLTNYDSLTAEVKIKNEEKAKRVLLAPGVRFHRVILDEAHSIKNRKALCAIGAFRLQADYRLAMTGTPLMNNADELFSVLHFLDIPQYSDWGFFNRTIGAPLNGRNSSGAVGSAAAMRNINELKNRTMLVRKKTDLLNGKPIISLPGHTDVIDHCHFDDDEKAFYAAIERKVQVALNKFMNASKGNKKFHILLVELLRLRQACCHPNLLASHIEQKENKQPENLEDLDAETLAAIEDSQNADELAGPARMSEGLFGVARLKSLAVQPEIASKKPNNKTTRTRAETLEYYRRLEKKYQPSSKINKTLEILKSIQETNPQDKIIVFSFFTSYLDILQIAFRRAGFVFKRYDGTMGPAEKDIAVRDFTSASSSTKILLTSLKSGNAGLNLNIANHVIIQEPFWNPFVEQQAIDRAHRIGQTKHVYVHRLLISGTVEEYITALQEEKKAMVSHALGHDDSAGKQKQFESMGGLTKDDLLNLLRPGLVQRKGAMKDAVMGKTNKFSATTTGPSKNSAKAPVKAPSRVVQGGTARTSGPTPAAPIARPQTSILRASISGPSKTGGKSQDRTQVGALARLATSAPLRVPAAAFGPRRSLYGDPSNDQARSGSGGVHKTSVGGMAKLVASAPPRVPAGQVVVHPIHKSSAEARGPGGMPAKVPPRFGEETLGESSAASRKFGATDLDELLAKHGGQGRRHF